MSTATVSRVINGQRHSSRKSLRHRRNAGGADEHARARLRPLRVLRWTGVDDIPMARFVTPPLTTVRVRMAELGARSLERLADAIETQLRGHRLGDSWRCAETPISMRESHEEATARTPAECDCIVRWLDARGGGGRARYGVGAIC